MHCCAAIKVNTINKIHIIGLGVVAQAQLSEEALQAINKADLIVGSKRQLQVIESVLNALPKPPHCEQLPALSALKKLINAHSANSTVVLASGDPLYYGIGRWFSRHYAAECLVFYPAVSSVQAACHVLGLALQDVDVLSLHGRPLETIRRYFQVNKTLLVLTDKHSTPQVLAKECSAAGLLGSELWVCEKLGYKEQRIRHYSVNELLALSPFEVDPLHVTVIKTKGRGGVQPVAPGIVDHAFQTGQTAGTGMISKREVRLAILSMMGIVDGDIIWDVGAGCGGVSVELARWNSRAQVYAIEQNEQRLGWLACNTQQFGVSSNCRPVLGRAPLVFKTLPSPSKVFIGGSDGALEGLLPDVWQRLPERGVLMATAVTDKTKGVLQRFCQSHLDASIECVELSVGRGELTDNGFLFNKKRPVMIVKLQKGGL